jgi:type II secretory ATPase GspE/PulE/Tfp pilus assembly ATPase PilB-like protein
VGVYELMRTTDGVRAAIEAEGSADEVRRRAIADGMRLMWQDGLDKARIGLTTLEEVARVVAVQSTGESEDAPERDVVRRLAA